MIQFVLSIYCISTWMEFENNLLRIALNYAELINDYNDTVKKLGLFSSFFTKDFILILIYGFLAWMLTFHGTHFERIPITFFVIVLFYSFLSRFIYLIQLQNLISVNIFLILFKILSIFIGSMFLVFYPIFKQIVIWFVPYLIYDFIDDIIEDLFEKFIFKYITRLVSIILFIGTVYLIFITYKWLKGLYEILFCFIFVIYGSLLMNLTISETLGLTDQFKMFIETALMLGFPSILNFNIFTFFWLSFIITALIYQIKYINEDYLNDKIKITHQNENTTNI